MLSFRSSALTPATSVPGKSPMVTVVVPIELSEQFWRRESSRGDDRKVHVD